MIVCRRRAPMFSLASLTCAASLAISSIASSVNVSLMPSVSSRAMYCRISAFLGSRRMRMKSSVAERLQLDANRKAALKFGDEVAGLRDVECSGGDEQDVIRSNETVACVDCGAFDDGENVALDTFATDVGAVAGLAAGDLVHFVEEDDAAPLHAIESGTRHLVHVDQLLLFFLDQIFERFGDAHLALAGRVGRTGRGAHL